MPQFVVTAPDGTKIRVTAPEGATETEAIAYAQEQYQPLTPEEPKAQATGMDRVNAAAAGVNSGVAGLLGLPIDTMQNVIDLGKAGAGYVYSKATGNDVPKALEVDSDRRHIYGSGQFFQRLLGSAAEIPRPDDAASRALFAGGQGASAALTGPAGGARVVPSLVSGIAGAEAAHVARESGVGPTGQLVAGMAGSVLTPAAPRVAAEGIKRTLRGGEEGRVRTAQNIQDFEGSGTRPTIGQATEGRFARSSESLMARTPGSAGVIARRATEQGNELAAGVERSAATLAPRSSAEQAGRAINGGVEEFSRYIRQGADQLYGIVDQHIPAQTPIAVSQTQRFLNQSTAPIQGAPATSQLLANNRMVEIRDALGADLQAAQSGQLPYQAVRALRTRVGEAIAGAGLVNDVPTGQLRRLYGALSTDLEAAAQAQGPVAARAATRANNFYRAGQRRLEVLQGVVDRNGGPEAIFRAATSGTKEGATTLRAVMQSLPADGQRMVSATILRRMGRANPGQQNELGERFSTESFLTNWNGLAPEAKAVLFNRYGPAFRTDMDRIARVASNLREGSQVFRNPSGTGQATTQTATATAFAVAAVTGHVGTAAAIGGGVVSANLTARLFTNPEIVHWLARGYRAPVSAIPALVTQLEKIDDPDAQELAALVKERYEQQNDTAAQPAQREREPQ